MKIAVYSLTHDRLAFTRSCFQSLWDRLGVPFDHYVFDNGSTDGTVEWLEAYRPRFADVVLSADNLGIARACNRLLDRIGARGPYDLVIKIDNDCEVVTPDLLVALVELLEGARSTSPPVVLSPRVEGLVHQPARRRYERIGGRKVGVTGAVGGIFLPVPGHVFQEYRYPEDLPLGIGDDMHLCGWLRERGVMIGYVEDLVVRHHQTTVGQWHEERAYFARRDREARADGPARSLSATVREVSVPKARAIPVAVVVPCSPSRQRFFDDFTLPSILANDPEQVVIVEGDGGAAAKRNAGFARTNTPFVFFCDDDIVLARGCLRSLRNVLEETPLAAYAYGDYVGISIPPGSHPLGPVFTHKARTFDAQELRQQNFISTMSLFRREAFPGFDETLRRLQDWDLFLTMLERGAVGVHVPEVLFHAYYLDQGITAKEDGAAAQKLVREKHGLDGHDDPMGISKETAEVLRELCKSYAVRTVVELGTGTGRSLRVFLEACHPGTRVVSVDSDPHFLGLAASEILERKPSVAGVSLVHAPLESYGAREHQQAWYARAAIEGIRGPIDLLFVDGPEGSVGRFPALPAFVDRMSPQGAIVLDDCRREDERKILDRWSDLIRSRGMECVVDLFPTDRGLGRIQLLGSTEEVALPPASFSERRALIVDADDFCEDNHGLELLRRIKAEIPGFKINLFTIVGRCSEVFLRQARQLDWVDLIPHGLLHGSPEECRSWSYEQSCAYLDSIAHLGFTKGFKAPGWQISDGMYRALLERGYWVADQRYNDARRPKGLLAYILDDEQGNPRPERKHFHIQNVCGNGLAERLDEILALRGDFRFIKDSPSVLEGGVLVLPDNALTLDRLIKRHGFTRGAELGVQRGELLAGLLRENPALSMVAVDLWADHPALDERHDHEGNHARFLDNVRGLESRVTVHRMLLRDAAERVEDESLDFVFIDAAHTYEAVSEDIRTWISKVTRSGIVSGYDYRPNRDHGSVMRGVHEVFRNVWVDEWNCWFAWKRDSHGR